MPVRAREMPASLPPGREAGGGLAVQYGASPPPTTRAGQGSGRAGTVGKVPTRFLTGPRDPGGA